MNNMPSKFISLTCLLIFWSITCFGQFEVGGFAGIAQYQGDLAEDHIEIDETLLSKGLFLRFHINPSITLRTNFYSGRISGDDKNAVGASRNRGWKFSSKITEWSLMGEWNIIPINRYAKYGRKFKPHFTPVIFGGFGITFADTNLTIPADYDLNLLQVPFPEPGDSDTFFCLPVGAGLRLDITPYTVLGFEFGWRTILSDYLDDVSENGQRRKGDWYSFLGVDISIFFGQDLY